VASHAPAQQVQVTFDKKVATDEKDEVTIGGKTYDRAELIKKLTAQLEAANTKARRLNPKAQSFTAIVVTKDCCASVTCAGGETIKCCVTGPGSCESGTFSVACITSTSSEVEACTPQGPP
jgi:hypothetical protein